MRIPATTFTVTPEVAPFVQDLEGALRWAADYPWTVTKTDSAMAGHSAKRSWEVKASKVQVVIYDLFGQKVRTVVEGEQPAGFYSLRWDGRNDDGMPLASGVYLYRIQTQGFTQTRKMVLVK
jgi:flagellar hook assembly protein FlgD